MSMKINRKPSNTNVIDLMFIQKVKYVKKFVVVKVRAQFTSPVGR